MSTEEDLVIANDDKNHASSAGVKEEIFTERVSRLQVGKSWRWLCLREGRDERQLEQESSQYAQKSNVAHFVIKLQSTKSNGPLKTEMQSIGQVSLDRYSLRGGLSSVCYLR